MKEVGKGEFKRWYTVAEGLTGNCEDQSMDPFMGRMEAQCCQIRRYRRDVIRNEGRQLSQDEAALEWIERYAESFAQDHDQP
jgi:hypothetical protein